MPDAGSRAYDDFDTAEICGIAGAVPTIDGLVSVLLAPALFIRPLKLPFALAPVFGFGLGGLVAQSLRFACLCSFFTPFVPEMHKDAPQRKADGTADEQNNDA
ncbi:MAG: hypothetical protein ACYCZ6_03325 [Polaromonas sp.]